MASTALPLSATPTSPGLTPNTRTEAEAALSYNALYQTSSAGGGTQYHTQTQSSTSTSAFSQASSGQHQGQSQSQFPSSWRGMPIRTTSHHYADACQAAGFPPTTPEPPYPTEESAEQVKGTLSRGTTQAVLRKMDSVSSGSGVGLDETALGRRISREGERRTSMVPPTGMIGGPSGSGGAGGTIDQGVEAGSAAAGQNAPSSMFGGGAGINEKPRFDRNQSWTQQDMKRLMQEHMMSNVEKDHGAEYGYESEVELNKGGGK